MRDYQVRILKPNRALAVALNGSYFSDFAAIRVAQSLKREGQTAEVWRDDECIFQETSKQPTFVPQAPAA